MRSRTELVTTTIDNSDLSDTDLEDSEDDWKPSADNKNGKRLRPVRRSVTKRGGGNRKKRPAAKKTKKYSSDDSSSDDDEPLRVYEKQHTAKKSDSAKTKSTKVIQEENPEDEDDDDSNSKCDDEESVSLPVQRPLQRKSVIPKSSIPDENGVLELFLNKSDVSRGGVDTKLCLWKRDGSSLLQKYVRNLVNKDEFIYDPSSVYSCWEDRKKDDYVQIKVQYHGDARDGKIKVIDSKELEIVVQEKMETDEGEDENEDENEANDDENDDEEDVNGEE